MANRRMISSDIWRDEFIGTLDLFGRILWIGIVTCADDQGRLPNNPRLIRSDIFPLDDYPTTDIERTINIFADAGKITTYEAEGKSIIQINNWWEYQTPSWAAPSKYPPPSGWTDRVKVHGKGTQVIMQNWDADGGYALPKPIPNPISNPLPIHINEGDVNGDGNGKGESDGNEPPTPFDLIRHLAEKITGIPACGPDGVKALDELVEMKATREDIQAGYDWIVGNGKTFKFYSQLVGPTRTAMSRRIQNGRASPGAVKIYKDANGNPVEVRQ